MLKNKNKKAFEMKIQFNFGAVFQIKADRGTKLLFEPLRQFEISKLV